MCSTILRANVEDVNSLSMCHICRDFRFSEPQLHTKLNLPCAGGLIGAADLSGGLAEGAGVGGQISGLGELDAIKQIVGLSAKIESDAFGEADGFL